MPIAESEGAQIAYVSEVSAGTTPDAPEFKVIRFNSEDIRSEKQTIVSNEIRADKNVTDVISTGYSISGGFTSEFSYQTFDDFMAFALRGTWQDDVVINGITRNSFSIEKKLVGNTDAFFVYSGCLVNTMSLSIDSRSIIEMSVTINGISSGDATTTEIENSTYTDANTEPVMSSGTFVGTISATGITNLPAIRTISLEINGNNREQTQVGSDDLAGIALGRLEVTGTIGFYFEEIAVYNSVVEDETIAIRIPLGNGDGRQYILEIPKAKMLIANPTTGGIGQDISFDVNFQGIYDDGIDGTIRITRNSRA